MAANFVTSGYETADKLKIFVSSRIGECRDERREIRRVVGDINHQSVLFEHIGARPQSPRRLYQARLRDSDIMVAVYRDGYGFIDLASGMAISGLEDEYRLAREYGIPILLYVYGDGTARDERLSALIDEISPDIVRANYSSIEELGIKVKEDLTSVITQGFLAPSTLRGVLSESAGELLRRGVRRQGQLVERPELLKAFSKALEVNSAVCVYGPGGIGKTVAIAQFAESTGATYIRLAGLAPKDIFSASAEAVRPPGAAKESYATLAGARLGFSAAWADRDNITLVVDECDYIDDLLSAIELGGGLSEARKVLFTSRACAEGVACVQVPPLTSVEVDALIGQGGGGQVPRDAIDGSPLAVQERLAKAELDAGGELGPGREILAYLALCPEPLLASQLIELIGDDQFSIEDLYRSIGRLGRNVDDSPRGFRLLHAESAAKVLTELKGSPQRLRFYVNRLLSVFDKTGDARIAYQVASHTGDGLEVRYANAALRQAAVLGDWRQGIAIADRLLNSALDAERRGEAFSLMLQLAYPMELMGDARRATELLDSAGAYAAELGDEAVAQYEEVRLASQARRTLSAGDMDALEELYASYIAGGDDWDGARLGLELSALYMAAKNYERSVELLRPAIAAFVEAEDAYGVDLAERNLASALSGIAGNGEEVDSLLARIEERATRSSDSRRQRAWVCNILTRRYRRAGRLDDAKVVAEEALHLAEELGDESLRAITYINLGNVATDASDVAAALAAYDEAGKVAQRCGRRDVEADASRLRAGVLNDIEGSAALVPDRHNQAAAFAQHAIALLRGSIYHEGLARSYLELADAQQELGSDDEAANAYFSALDAFLLVPDEECADLALINGARKALDFDDEFYVETLSSAIGVVIDSEKTIADQFSDLIVPILCKIPERGFIRILGRHLHTIRSNLPAALRPAIFEAVTISLQDVAFKFSVEKDPWRLLYLGLIIPLIAQDNRKDFFISSFARSVVQAVNGIYVRELRGGWYTWTVIVNLDVPVTVTVETLDDSFASAVAALCLAVFLKAFERDMRGFVGAPLTREVWLQVASFNEMPDDLKSRIEEMGAPVEKNQVIVTRPTDFSSVMPTFIVLGEEFLAQAALGEGLSGTIQLLLGLTTTELVYQLFRGEVNGDEIRPKIVSMVRRTLS